MDVRIIERKRGTAEVDVHLVGGAVTPKGASVNVELQYCRDWPAGGFRTVTVVGYTNGQAYYQVF